MPKSIRHPISTPVPELQGIAGIASHTPTTNAPVADAREEAVKLITAHLEWLAYGQQDDDRDEYTLADAILALRQTLPIHGEMREALKTAISHIEHMAAWISKLGSGYSFECLGEDMPAMKAALAEPCSIEGSN